MDLDKGLKVSLDVIKCIATLPTRENKKSKLMQALKITDFDDEEDLRKSILIDYLLDNIMFSVNQGFHWKSVHAYVDFAVNILKETACSGLPLERALEVFRSKLLSLHGKMAVREIKSCMDYMFDNLFQHYKLYLVCMTKDREVVLKELHVTVDPPPTDICSLKKGDDIETWTAQQKIKDIEKERAKLKEERSNKLQEELAQLEEETLNAIAKLDLEMDSFEEKDLSELIEDITKSHAQYTETELRSSIIESKDNIDFDLKRGLFAKGVASSKGTKSSRARSKTKMKGSVSRLAP